ncbi:hypothetical protein JCM3765_001615 [Sporobolomyces pararoseus]
MIFRPALLATFALAPLVLAQDNSQSDGDITAGLFADFPQQCLDTCMAMETLVASCSATDAEVSNEALACVCNSQFVNTLESCGSCVVPAAGMASQSGNVIAQLALSVSRNCGMAVSIDGITNEEVSSELASPTASPYSATASQPTTSSTTPSASSSSSVTSTSSSSTSSSSPSSSAPSPSQTGTAQNGANTLRYGTLSSVLGLVVIVGLVIYSSLLAPSNMSTNRQPIPNTGSLKDRIAKLNLNENPSSSSSPSPSSGTNSGPPSPTAVRTGATSKISDKISRFQVNAESNPLLPSGGSFGLAPARPSGSKERANEKPRVASLGAGRAPVPLNVVKPTTRSVSAGNVGSRSASENGSVGSGLEARKAGSVGSGGGTNSRPGTPLGSRPGSTYEASLNETPTTSVESTTSPLDNQQFSNLLAPEPRTPGAMSVSSMNVETGSIASASEREREVEGNSSEYDVTPSLAPSEPAEPSNIPTLNSEPQEISPLATPTSAASIASSSDDAPATPPSLPVKGPLEHLRQPSRSGSIASMSSLVVEAPPEDVADLEAMSTGRPSTTSEVHERTSVTPTPTDDGNVEEEGDERRLERTNEELKKYENDQEDPTAHGPGPEEEGGLPVRPTWDAEEDGSAVPKVKCSDCDASVDLLELADHSCAPSRQSPSLGSAPSSPSTRKTDHPESSTTQPDSDQPGTTLSGDHVEEATRTPLAGSAVLGTAPDQVTKPATLSNEPQPPSSDKLDDYVPQTKSIVPEDIAPEEEEDDVLDFYGEEPVSPTEKSSSSRPVDADVPLDLDEEEHLHEANTSSSSTTMSRSMSQPTTRAPKESAGGPRSHSVYLPGHYEDDDDEGYQGGTVTIVRSSR